jgi:hypothetical protein
LDANTYTIEVDDANSCGPVTSSSLDIVDPEVISITSESVSDASSESASDGSITIEATGGTGALVYQLSPGSVSNGTGVFEDLSPGNYTVEVDDANSCGPITSNDLEVGFTNSIGDFIIPDFIKIYPNPTSNRFYLELDYNEDLSVEILNLGGEIILNKDLEPEGFIKMEFDLTDKPKGIYLVRIYNTQISYKTKILLQ